MSNHRTAGDFIFDAFRETLDELGRHAKQKDIDRFNENTENRKHELYHQGEDEVGELMQSEDEED